MWHDLELPLHRPAVHDARTLRELLWRLDPSQFEPLARFSLESYRRIVLARTSAFELMLACWLPGQASPIHDHGGCVGATRVVDGRLVEERFSRLRGGVRLRQRRSVAVGQTLLEFSDTIHRVRNDSGRRAISLHLYSPPLHGLRTYVECKVRTARAAAPA